MNIIDRPRRLRRTAAMRRMVRETRIDKSQLILPVFVAENLSAPKAIDAMPGVMQHTLDSLRAQAVQCVKTGIGGIDLFGIPALRDGEGSQAWDENGILNQAIKAVKAEVGDELLVIADTCLDEFTDHGHCGVLDNNAQVDNDETLKRYILMALAQADAGVDMVSPSGMMDGQVAAIRQALDNNKKLEVAILAYSAKYASAFFGPFREAVDSQLVGDRASYQQDPANRREGLRETLLDLAEGADIVMVKPASHYLDVVSDIAQISTVPVAAYQVSGEYAMLEAAAAKGWIDRDRAITESIISIARAGADVILSYWALELGEKL